MGEVRQEIQSNNQKLDTLSNQLLAFLEAGFPSS